ncbi:MAG: 50S ribosomal protein L23 [Spirochaetaceae bacterium]|jgi:large subunit ribosomal protein L23|nr:50S ribosomal protein L23 [Spirochaetaceae bacterium]GMO17828.1 MAG: 50S ribosomal protein L23 [Termitinemataceae bacterium]
MNYETILVEPVLSEKTNNMRESCKYVFKVDPRASKLQIKEAVRRVFKVTPVSCNVMNVPGKPKRLRYKAGKTPEWKKAIVTIKQGEKIALFEGV